MSEHRKIIIDTDTGADDASALILAAKQQNVEILGVTVLVGNVDLEQSTQNALAALETAGCDAPVYKGFAYDVVKNDFDYNVVLVTNVDKPSYFKNYIEAIK